MIIDTLKYADAFRERLRPFGLDKFMINNYPHSTQELKNGRVLAEFRTMMLPVWYPEKLNELVSAGLEVEIIKRQYRSHPPQLMYYVRQVCEIGGNYGNQ